MNNVVITGRLINDGELKQTRNGKMYCDYAISVYDGKNTDGSTRSYILNVRSWELEFSSQMKKGTMVCVNGRLKIESYNDKKYTRVETNGFDTVSIIPQRAKQQSNNNNGGFDSDAIPF